MARPNKQDDMILGITLNLDQIEVGDAFDNDTIGELLREIIRDEIKAVARKIVREDPRVKAAVKKAMMAGLESLTEGDKK